LIAGKCDDPALRHVEQALSDHPDISDRIAESPSRVARIRLDYFVNQKTWLVTAFEKGKRESGDMEYSGGPYTSGADQPYPRLPTDNPIQQDQTAINPNNDIKHGAPL
jgi:hypothetical protein